MNLLLLVAIPVVVSIVAFLLFEEITWKEMLAQLGCCLVLLLISWQIAKWSGLSSTQILNGRITQKVAGTQSCCHCWTVCDARDKKGNCTSSHEECSHSQDYYWDLRTTVGTMPVEHCSGQDEPPAAWTRAYVGEPASAEDSYTNYLKADPDSIFVHRKMSGFIVPKYPDVYGLYKIDHVLGLDVDVPPPLQSGLREINADLGSRNQVDVTMILTRDKRPELAQAIEAEWLYGPKNSVTIVAGVEGASISWVRVVTLSRVEELKVQLRDKLQGMKLDDPAVLGEVRELVAREFKRTPMAEFEYLARTAEPHGWALAVLCFLQLAVSIGLSVLMHREDLFGEEIARKWARI